MVYLMSTGGIVALVTTLVLAVLGLLFWVIIYCIRSDSALLEILSPKITNYLIQYQNEGCVVASIQLPDHVCLEIRWSRREFTTFLCNDYFMSCANQFYIDGINGSLSSEEISRKVIDAYKTYIELA